MNIEERERESNGWIRNSDKQEQKGKDKEQKEQNSTLQGCNSILHSLHFKMNRKKGKRKCRLIQLFDWDEKCTWHIFLCSAGCKDHTNL